MGLAILGQRVFHGTVLISHYLAKVQDRVLVEIGIGYQHWVIPTLRVVQISLLRLFSTMGRVLRYTCICVRQISKIWFVVLHHYGLQGWRWMTHWSESVKHWVSRYHCIWISLQQWCHQGQVLVLQGWLTYQSSCLWVVQRVLDPIAHKVLVPGLTWLGHLLHQGVARLGSFDVRLDRNMQWILSRLSLGVKYVCILLAIAVPYGRQLLQTFVMIENRLVVVLVVMWKRAFLPLLVHGGHSISTFLVTLVQGMWTVSCIIWSMMEPSVPVFQQHISQAVDEVTLRIGHGVLGWAKNLQYQQHASE
ncbi:hypothetical protein IWQ61_003917 [Dispira simplex]|nr:hypothetical protein IWQ61_003917 [Dispira simplex]